METETVNTKWLLIEQNLQKQAEKKMVGFLMEIIYSNWLNDQQSMKSRNNFWLG